MFVKAKKVIGIFKDTSLVHNVIYYGSKTFYDRHLKGILFGWALVSPERCFPRVGSSLTGKVLHKNMFTPHLIGDSLG